MRTVRLLALVLFGCAGGSLMAAPPARTERDANPPELGRVRWHRDHDVAFAAAKRENKDVFLLFQEVPG